MCEMCAGDDEMGVREGCAVVRRGDGEQLHFKAPERLNVTARGNVVARLCARIRFPNDIISQFCNAFYCAP